jgi:hypothetical protein
MEEHKDLKEQILCEFCGDIIAGAMMAGFENFKEYKGASELMKGMIIAEIYRLRRDNEMLRKEIEKLQDKRQTDLLEYIALLKR